MTAAALLINLADRGVRLGVEDGSLTVRASRGVLTAEDRDALRDCKPELIALVAVPPIVSHEAGEPDDWPASWAADFEEMKAENIRLGHIPGEAARLAYEVLKARAA